MSYRFAQFGAGLALMISLASAPQLHAAGATYTATGGQFSGSLGGVQFENADWSITATADTSDILLTTEDFASYEFLPTFATITIPGLSPATFTSPEFGVLAVDYHGNIPDGQAAYGFVDLGRGGLAILSPDPYVSLSTVSLARGVSLANGSTYATSAGDLVITGDTGGPGTFTVSYEHSSVPEASTMVLGVLSAVPLLLNRRRAATSAA